MENDIEIKETLLSKFLAGEASPEEAMKIENWAAKSDANQAALDSCYRIFNLPDKLHLSSNNRVWTKIVRGIENHEGPKRLKITGWHVGIAASIILLIFIGVLINYSHKNKHDLVYYATSSDKKLQLNDASEITLWPRSALTVDKDFGISNRKLKLTGSAFFSVKHHKAAPLIIDLNGFYVQDLGTKFTIRLSGNADTIYIAVEEGKVSAYDDLGAKMIINPHETAFYIKSTKKLARSAINNSSTKVLGTNGSVNRQNTSPETVKNTPKVFSTDTNKLKRSEKPVPADSDLKNRSHPANNKPVPIRIKTRPGSSGESKSFSPKTDNPGKTIGVNLLSPFIKPKPGDSSLKKPD